MTWPRTPLPLGRIVMSVAAGSMDRAELARSIHSWMGAQSP